MRKVTRMFTCVILASLIWHSFTIQTFSQAGNGANDLANQTVSGGGLRRNVNNFDQSLTQAQVTFGDQQVFTFLAQGIGEPPQLLRVNLQNSGLTLNRFIMARIIARLSGNNLALIVGLFNQNLSVSQILALTNVRRDIFIFALKIFTDTFNTQVAIFNGNSQLPSDQVIQQLRDILNRTDNDFTTFNNKFGTRLFNAALIQQISQATDIPIADILTVQEALLNRATNGQIAIALIAANSINVNNGIIFDPINSDQISKLLNSPDLATALVGNGIPVSLFIGRVRLLLRILIAADNNGNFTSLAG